MAGSRAASRRATATSRFPACPASASKAKRNSRAGWRGLRACPRRLSSKPPGIEAKRHRQQALPIIEPVRERVLERGVEYELAAAERAAFRLETIQQPRAMAMAALALVGHQIIDIDKTAVHQIFLHPEARQGDRTLIAPESEHRIALLRLPPPALDELCLRGEMRAQHAHQRKASRNVRFADDADVQPRGERAHVADAHRAPETRATGGGNRSAP